jgi:putative transposase
MSALRMAFRVARHERPFTIEAVVVVPEHLHVVWTLLYIPRHAPIVSRD